MSGRVEHRERGRSRSRSGSPRRRDRDHSGGRHQGEGRHGDHSGGRHHIRRDRSTSKSRSRSPKRRRHRSHSNLRRSGSRSRSRERHKKRRSRSRSTSSSSSDDSKRHKRRKEKHRKRSSQSRERKERRKEKKEKKHKKKKKSGASSSQWGHYGIINESDMYNKEQEFRTWLVEERKINPETISKDQNKKEFARFVEDFNTATLPHEKYYNMDQYERRMSAMRRGEFVPPPSDSYDPNADMAAHSSSHKRKVIEQESYLSKEQLQELRKVQNERIEVGKMKLLGMDIKQTFGVRMDGSMFDG